MLLQVYITKALNLKLYIYLLTIKNCIKGKKFLDEKKVATKEFDTKTK